MCECVRVSFFIKKLPSLTISSLTRAVSASHQRPNLDPAERGWSSNNGTLEHEVWMGDLTQLNGSARRVVALFNKGGSMETISVPASLYARDVVNASGATVHVRDVVNREDTPLGVNNAIEANVPRHGVALYVITF